MRVRSSSALTRTWAHAFDLRLKALSFSTAFLPLPPPPPSSSPPTHLDVLHKVLLDVVLEVFALEGECGALPQLGVRDEDGQEARHVREDAYFKENKGREAVEPARKTLSSTGTRCGGCALCDLCTVGGRGIVK